MTPLRVPLKIPKGLVNLQMFLVHNLSFNDSLIVFSEFIGFSFVSIPDISYVNASYKSWQRAKINILKSKCQCHVLIPKISYSIISIIRGSCGVSICRGILKIGTRIILCGLDPYNPSFTFVDFKHGSS